jgi:hypothetical protein
MVNMACAVPTQPKKKHTAAPLFALFSTVQYHAGHTMDFLHPPPLTSPCMQTVATSDAI